MGNIFEQKLQRCVIIAWYFHTLQKQFEALKASILSNSSSSMQHFYF